MENNNENKIESVEEVLLTESQNNINFIEEIIRNAIKEESTLVVNYIEINPCKVFNENNKFISIDETRFLNVRRRESKASQNVSYIKKTTIERYKSIANRLNNMEKIKGVVPNSDVGGVYFFVANQNISLNLFDVFKNFIVIQIYESCLKTVLMSSPKINLNSNDNNIVIKKGEIIYVGESKHLTSRYYQHINGDLSGTASMKFGLREDVFGIHPNTLFDTYIIRENDSKKRTELERFIRNYYHPRFGK